VRGHFKESSTGERAEIATLEIKTQGGFSGNRSTALPGSKGIKLEECHEGKAWIGEASL